MGCFFGCFGIKESRSSAIDSPVQTVSRSKHALSSLFVSDDETLQKGDGGRSLIPQPHKDEVKFLKSHGASFKAQTEHQKVLDKGNGGTSPQTREDKSLKLSSWFSNASTNKLQPEKQSVGYTAVENRQDGVTGSGSFVESPTSCMTDRHNAGQVSSSSILNQGSVPNASTPVHAHGSETLSETSSISPLSFTPGIKSMTKSNISFYSSQGSSSECVSQFPNHSDFSGGKITTPLKVTNEMENPSTNFHAYIDDAYSVSKPVESSSDHLSELHKLDDEETLLETPMLGTVATQGSINKETEDDEGSLSSWFKPVSVKHNGHTRQHISSSTEKISANTPGDRPILGMVAAYWNEDEKSDVLPKWWDGNGIPNSTNKYKEDQKVSWHATPFEERLEKALSEETSISQSKTVPPVDFNAPEDSDTAFSRLRSSSSHTRPAISFLEKGDTIRYDPTPILL